MKKFIGIAFIALLVLAGCKSTGNKAASIFNPIIGTWTISVLGIPTTLVFNADKTCTETTSALGLGITKNGTWTAGAKTIVRYWSDKEKNVQYYTFNSDRTQMTLSPSPDGIATTYTSMK